LPTAGTRCSADLVGNDWLMEIGTEHHETTAAPRSVDSGVSRERKILCVDDEDEILAMLCEVLTGSGFRVLCESDAERARQMVHSLDMDAVVLDYQMPGCNGLELASAIRAIKPNLPIVMFSGAPPPGELPTTVTSFVAKSHGVFRLIDTLQQELKRSVPGTDPGTDNVRRVTMSRNIP
jgi:CheY-like chemotaxis protein